MTRHTRNDVHEAHFTLPGAFLSQDERTFTLGDLESFCEDMRAASANGMERVTLKDGGLVSVVKLPKPRLQRYNEDPRPEAGGRD
jgi:hypothetical protein